MRKSIILIAILMLLLSGLCSCESYNKKLERVQQVQPEIDYGYTVFSGSSITKDNQVYYCESMVAKLVQLKEKYRYPYCCEIVGNYYYFFFQYAHVNKAYDVGLFRVDIDTLACELVYDFKNIFSTDGVNPSLGRIIDENRAIIRYNGAIQVLDLQQKKIAYSVDIYDQEQSQEKTCRYNEYGDFRVVADGKLDYYELDGYKFTQHQYDIENGVDDNQVARIGKYVYTYKNEFMSNTVYYDCYDLTSDQQVDLDILREEIANNRKQTEEEKNVYIINYKKYYIDNRYGLTILDEDKNQIGCIDEKFMQANSKAFVALSNLWTNNEEHYEIRDYVVVDNKLFVGFYALYGLGCTPTYIYEYDIESKTIRYVGFAYNGLIDTLRLHSK